MKLVLSILSLFLVAGNSYAHPDFEKLAQKLNLDGSQTEKLQQIHQQTKKDFDCRSFEDRLDRRECKMEAKLSIRDKFKEVLSDEQYANWRELRKEKMGKRRR